MTPTDVADAIRQAVDQENARCATIAREHTDIPGWHTCARDRCAEVIAAAIESTRGRSSSW